MLLSFPDLMKIFLAIFIIRFITSFPDLMKIFLVIFIIRFITPQLSDVREIFYCFYSKNNLLFLEKTLI